MTYHGMRLRDRWCLGRFGAKQWRASLLLTVMMLLLIPVPGVEAQPTGCAEAAHVTWETDWDDVTLSGAVVEVRGCEDGTSVGLQLLTDDGDVPAEALVSDVVDEHARFALESLGQHIEPVTGVRILIYGTDTQVLDEGFEQVPPATVDDSLALTGLNVLAVGLIALVLLTVGRRLVRTGR